MVAVHYKHDRYILITQTCPCNILEFGLAFLIILNLGTLELSENCSFRTIKH